MLVDKGISIHKYQLVLNTGNALFFSLTILIPLWSLMHYVILEKSDSGRNSWSNSFLSSSLRSFPSSKGGSLSENSFIAPAQERVCLLPLPELSKQLVVLEHIARPDCVKNGKLLLFGIEGSRQKLLVNIGEKVFLDCKNEKEISFSEEIGPFWFEANLLGDGQVEVALHAEFKGDNQEVIYKEVQNISLLMKKDFELASHGEKGTLAPIIDYLGKVKICETDLLIEMYGGKSFDDVKGSYRMYSDKIRAPFFIKPGDLFVWKDGGLEEGKGATQEATKGFPLLMIKSLDMQKCELLLWDTDGMYGKPITLAIGMAIPSQLKVQEFFLKLHQRTDASVTCQLHKRNVIIRKGDWLLYSKGKFRNLRTFDEVNDYLRYALKGELFIFDGLVKKEGITSFVGHLFNEERTQAKNVDLVLSERKKPAPLKKKDTKVLPVQVKDE